MFKSSIIFLCGELLSKMMPFLLLPYLTATLGVDGFGELSNVLAYVSIFFVLINLSQNGALTRYYYFYGERGIYKFIVVGYFYAVIIALLILVIGLYLEDSYIIYAAIVALSQVIMSSQLSLQQCQKKPFSYVTIQFTQSFLSVVFTILLFQFYALGYEERLIAIFIGNTLATLIGLLLIKQNKSHSKKLCLSKRQIIIYAHYLLSFGLPLMLHALSVSTKGQFDKIYIAQLFSFEELGVYSAGLQIALILSVILMAVNKALVPYYFEALKEKKVTVKNVKQWVIYTLLILFLSSFIIYLIPGEIYQLVLGQGFERAKYYTVVFWIGFTFVGPYLILVNILFYYKKNIIIAYSTLGSAVVYLVLIYIFSLFSIFYIPFALIISNVIMVSYLYYYVMQNKAEFLKQESSLD